MTEEVSSMDTTENNQEKIQESSEQADAPVTKSNEDRKLFIGGLGLDTTEQQLKEYFEQFGEIESVTLKTDAATGKSRGFAFIVFNSSESLEKTLSNGEHTINNKTVDAKKAKARQGKIFVGGLSADLTDDDIKEYFGKFGNIVEVEMPFDKMKNQRKAFCFITYDSDQIVNEILKTPKQMIKDKPVDVKKANQKPGSGPNFGGNGRFNQRGGGGFRGRGGRGRGGPNNFNNRNFGGFSQDCYGYDNGYNNYDYYGGGYQSFDGGYNNGYNYGTTDGFQGGKQRGAGGNARFQRQQPY